MFPKLGYMFHEDRNMQSPVHHRVPSEVPRVVSGKEIQPVYSEGDQPWDFFGRNDAEAETPIPWPPHAKS